MRERWKGWPWGGQETTKTKVAEGGSEGDHDKRCIIILAPMPVNNHIKRLYNQDRWCFVRFRFVNAVSDGQKKTYPGDYGIAKLLFGGQDIPKSEESDIGYQSIWVLQDKPPRFWVVRYQEWRLHWSQVYWLDDYWEGMLDGWRYFASAGSVLELLKEIKLGVYLNCDWLFFVNLYVLCDRNSYSQSNETI